MKLKSILFIPALFLFISCGQRINEYYVSPSGSDSNTGTKKNPFVSFARAKDAALAAMESGKREIHVYFREGTYYFEKSVTIRGKVLSEGKSRVSFSAYRDEKPVFSAGKILTGWTQVKDNIPFLPEIAKGKIWVTDIPSTKQGNVARFLCDKSGSLTNSISGALYTAENDTIRMLRDDAQLSSEQRSFFVFPKQSFREWENIQDIEIVTIPHYSWIINILPLEAIDMANSIANTSIPATYRICKGLHYGEPNLWIQNAIDYLDEPGEWVINSLQGKIYYWPKGETPGDVYYPMTQEIIKIEGDEEKGEIVKNIIFRGITFTHADRFTPGKEDKDLRFFSNTSNSLLRFIDSENCIVDNCTFTNSGGGSIRFDRNCKRNAVINCSINNLGGTGLLFIGHPENTEIENANEIINNEIHDIGKIYKHSSAVSFFNSSGNRIANNLIYNTPYNALALRGKNTLNNVIEYNEFHDNCLELHDGNVLYLNTLNSNLVYRNYLHNNLSTKLHGIIRSDDFGRDIVISENIIYKYCGSGIRFKQSTVVTNNYIIDCIPAKSADGDIISLSEFIGVTPSEKIKGSVVKNNVCYQSNGATQPFFRMTFSPRYPNLKDSKVSDIDMDNNLYFATVEYNEYVSLLNSLQKQGIDRNSIITDPLFKGFAEAGFRLSDNSPAFKLGVKQIEDFAKMGLLKEPVK